MPGTVSRKKENSYSTALQPKTHTSGVSSKTSNISTQQAVAVATKSRRRRLRSSAQAHFQYPLSPLAACFRDLGTHEYGRIFLWSYLSKRIQFYVCRELMFEIVQYSSLSGLEGLSGKSALSLGPSVRGLNSDCRQR